MSFEFRVPSSVFRVPCSKSQVANFRFHVSETLSNRKAAAAEQELCPTFRWHVIGRASLLASRVPSERRFFSRIDIYVYEHRYAGAWLLDSETWNSNLGTSNLELGTRNLKLRTRNAQTTQT
jgi:hypothetical protein